jgi:hypothetical protein
MGGFGSGRHRVKTRIEDCLILSIGTLHREKLLRKGKWPVGEISWDNGAMSRPPSVGFILGLTDPIGWLILNYTQAQTVEVHKYCVRLIPSPLPWGGVRWSFLCPNATCGRVCRKLYLPSGAGLFACRLCHRLTYRSAQEAHKYDSMFGRLGISPQEARELFT